MGDGVLEDIMIGDGLQCAIASRHMGIHGGNVAAEEEISREEQDARKACDLISARSRAGCRSPRPRDRARRDCRQRRHDHRRRGRIPRRDTSAEALARLKPVFDSESTVTAGNAPGINDGAAALHECRLGRGQGPSCPALESGARRGRLGRPYLAYTPAMAAEKALFRLGKPSDVDVWEINEAFSSVPIISSKARIDPCRVNVNGGAIAFGHPIGASGAWIVLSLIEELRRRGGGLGVAAICSGGGGGDAIVLEMPGKA